MKNWIKVYENKGLRDRRAEGERNGRSFRFAFDRDDAKSGTCSYCGGPTRRSIYGILHEACSGCRYLVMIYGPNISVERRGKK